MAPMTYITRKKRRKRPGKKETLQPRGFRFAIKHDDDDDDKWNYCGVVVIARLTNRPFRMPPPDAFA